MLDKLLEQPSAITRVQHDGTSLRVHYRSGGAYDYEDVSTELANGLIKAESAATFMITRIKNDREAVPVPAGAPFPRLAWD